MADPLQETKNFCPVFAGQKVCAQPSCYSADRALDFYWQSPPPPPPPSWQANPGATPLNEKKLLVNCKLYHLLSKHF